MSTPARTAVSVLTVALLLAGTRALAQNPSSDEASGPTSYQSPTGTTFITGSPHTRITASGEQVLSFRKEANVSVPDGPVMGPARSAPPRAEEHLQRVFHHSSPLRESSQVALLQGGDRRMDTAEGSMDADIPLAFPGNDRLFQLESEKSLMERMRQSARDKGEPTIFPKEPVISTGTYVPRTFPMAVEVVEPHYLCHKRLLFQDLNSERYGWDLGIIQPVVSAGLFYKDLVLLPYHYFTRPCDCYECSAGYCLPGDPVPYLCYPPEISVTGAVAEAGVVAGILAAFP